MNITGSRIKPHPEERRRQPLASAVAVALERYFEQLDGHEPDNLYRMVIEEVERPLLQCVMEQTAGNQCKAATWLGISRGTLRKKLRLHDLL
ncbi:MAG: helix-turn-helix domain-containing protein [Gammaproteobacteria bacterium]|jgi:Fis family transcriptional regulator